MTISKLILAILFIFLIKSWLVVRSVATPNALRSGLLVFLIGTKFRRKRFICTNAISSYRDALSANTARHFLPLP